MTLHERLLDLVEPIVAQQGLELFDLTYTGGTLSVLVQRPVGVDVPDAASDVGEPGASSEPGASIESGDASAPATGRGAGVDMSAITAITRAVSRALDDADPIQGQYSLEVSSPGLERPLRTPAHFAGALGETISVKTLAATEGPRRVKGELVAASDDDITIQPVGAERLTIALADIDKARTVFEWGPEPKPTRSSTASKKSAPKSATSKSATTSKAANKKVTSS